ncbi:hypothetical protein [Flavobacterium nackdongense]|uniref:Uncharacterized protein n=1 Tax=Flavobacterium nackdongense TaxID=2547394 RepID=A0A4P6YGG8_9FLAO|nr:hypothetical protein [Flavobacterium nackdongense]QBN19660.1 hypothetical protein E1750_12890 [Flavobacterium nackdongense]
MEMNPNTSAHHTIQPKRCPTKLLRNKWDKRLDDYENYLKEYVKHYKKSLKGNLISLAKYAYMQAKSEDLFELLTQAQNKGLLTENQLKRIEKIQLKTLYSNCT